MPNLLQADKTLFYKKKKKNVWFTGGHIAMEQSKRQ